MKHLVVLSIIVLFAAGCETVPMSSGGGSGDNVRYDCYTFDYPAKHVLTLPVAPLNSDFGTVDVTFHGDQLEALYTRSGLSQMWMFEERLYLELDPDLTAAYYDFRGAEVGEKRKPESVFECKKRR